jgi:hypothetical protein
MMVHPLQVGFGEVAAGDSGLVGNDDQPEAGLLEGAELGADAGDQTEVLGPGRIVVGIDESAVAV